MKEEKLLPKRKCKGKESGVEGIK
jgi:hypothetical protein